MKILLLVTQADFGGAQRAVFELATGLKDQFDITVAAGEPQGSDELLRRCSSVGVRTIRLNHLRRAINPWHDLLAVFELRRLIKKERFDIVHAHSSKAGIISAIANSKLPLGLAVPQAHRSARLVGLGVKQFTPHSSSTPNSKLVYTAHGWVFQEPLSPPRRAFYLILEKLASKKRDATIVLSKSEKDVARTYGLGDETTLRVIPNGVSCPPVADRANNGFVVGTIANLYATKGLDTLVVAADLVRAEEPRARFVIVGHGPEEKRIRDDINRRNLENVVELAGYIPNATTMISTFDLFVLSSRKEGLPFAILDAAATGIPIVATAVGGIPEVLRDKVDALTIPKDDPKALAEAILTLLRDHDLAQRLATSARARICAEYTLERMLRETTQLYRTLLH